MSFDQLGHELISRYIYTMWHFFQYFVMVVGPGSNVVHLIKVVISNEKTALY